jgi:hypothetical protein
MTDPVYPYRYEGVYTFRYENGDKTVTVEVGGEKTLPVLLEEIQYFLQACGYSFHLNEHIEVVDNSYSNDEQRDEWADADLDGWGEEKDPHWQADGQQWQTNGWDETDVDGPTEFAFNGTKESDFYTGLKNNGLGLGNMRSDPLYGAVPPNTDPIVDESGSEIGKAGKKRK